VWALMGDPDQQNVVSHLDDLVSRVAGGIVLILPLLRPVSRRTQQ
jgi:hypothetical protein